MLTTLAETPVKASISEMTEARVAEVAAKLPGVAVAKTYPYMCSDPGQSLICADIEEHGLEGWMDPHGLNRNADLFARVALKRRNGLEYHRTSGEPL